MKLFFLSFLSLLAAHLQAQHSFKIIPLGVKGGSDECNLSSYMLAPANSSAYVCLDAGTVYSGINKAVSKGLFHADASAVLKDSIKAFFISHAHLDHVAGMILNSPEDSAKNIYALPSIIEVLKDKYFTWKGWANFTNEGEAPTLNKYRYMPLEPGVEKKVEHTALYASAFPLSHGNPYESTAFLIRNQENYLVYLGDTGPDEVEKSDRLQLLWKQIAPLIQTKKLKAIFIEVSFPDEQPDKQLFGHLTPRWLMKEMDVLSDFAGKNSMKGLPVVITHIKPSGNNETMIKKQIAAANDLELKIIYAKQGELLRF